MRGKTSQSAGEQEPKELREQAWRSKWGLDLYLKNNEKLFKGIANRGMTSSILLPLQSMFTIYIC